MKGARNPRDTERGRLPAPRLFYGWIVVAGASLVMLLSYGVQYSFGVFFSAMLQELGWSRAGLGGAFSLYALVYHALGFWSGRLSDQLGPRWVVALGGIFLGGGMILVSWIREPWQLYLAFGLVSGVGMSASYVPCVTTVVRWFRRRRGLALGITGSGASLGIAALPPISEALIGRLGWRTSYLVLGATILILLNLIAPLLRRDPGQLGLETDGHDFPKGDTPLEALETEPAWTLGEALRTPPFWLVTGVIMLSVLNFSSVFVHLPQHARDLQLGVPRSSFILVIGLSSLLGNLLLGWISDRLGRRTGLLLSLAAGALALAAFGAAKTPLTLYLASAAFGLHYGTLASLFPAVMGDFFGRRHAGSLTGFVAASASLSSAIGPLAMGLLADRWGGYSLAFLCASLISAAALGLLSLARPPRHPPSPTHPPAGRPMRDGESAARSELQLCTPGRVSGGPRCGSAPDPKTFVCSSLQDPGCSSGSRAPR